MRRSEVITLIGCHGQPPVRDKGVLAGYPVIFYFIIAYAGSWLVVLPYLRSPGGAGLLPFNWPIPFPVSAALAPFAGRRWRLSS